jgi:AraC-like DNA-binding protein
MTRTSVDPPQGILAPAAGRRRFDLRWYEPADDLSFFVQRHWVVEWDLRGRAPYRQDVLTYPCVNVVFEPRGPSAYGVPTRRFSRLLDGSARCVAVRFRAAGFQPFARMPMSRLVDRVVPLDHFFDGLDDLPDLLALDDRDAVEAVEHLLRAQRVERDPTVALVNAMVDEIVSEPDLTTVDGVAARFDTTPRTLQRLFSRYVGVSPKWLIRRCRLGVPPGEYLHRSP